MKGNKKVTWTRLKTEINKSQTVLDQVMDHFGLDERSLNSMKLNHKNYWMCNIFVQACIPRLQ